MHEGPYPTSMRVEALASLLTIQTPSTIHNASDNKAAGGSCCGRGPRKLRHLAVSDLRMQDKAERSEIYDGNILCKDTP